MCKNNESKLPNFCKWNRIRLIQLRSYTIYCGVDVLSFYTCRQGCISCETCSYPELTEDHVLTSAYVKIFRIVTRNAVNKSFCRKKDCSWPPLNKYAMNIWFNSLRIRAHLSWGTGKHLHVLHVLRTYSTCSYPGYQDTTTYAALLYRDRALLLHKALAHCSSVFSILFYKLQVGWYWLIVKF